MACAVRQGDREKVVELLEAKGGNANLQNDTGNSLLMLACRYVGGSTDIIKELLDQGASLCVCCDAGKTPMHDLLWMIGGQQHFDIVKRFIMDTQHQGNMFLMEDHHGYTPLDYLQEALWPEFNSFLACNACVFWPQGEALGEHFT
jgi:ankyrin repeat protein